MTKISAKHKNHQQFHQELAKAGELVKVGEVYAHFKNPKNSYKVLELAILEATDEVCVIYQARYDEKLIFVRPLSSWLETSEWEGKKVARFQIVSSG